MKPITTYRQTVCRLLAALFFLCLFAPMAAGQDSSAEPTYWKDKISGVEKIANSKGGDGTRDSHRRRACLLRAAGE